MTKKTKYLIRFITPIILFILILTAIFRKKDKEQRNNVSPSNAEVSIGKNDFQFACGVSPLQINKSNLDTSNVQKLVFNPPFKWHKNNLRVYFTDIDDSNLKQKKLNVAKEWSQNANIKFILNESIYASDIRVSFREQNGYFSAIGNFAETKSYLSGPTMWLYELYKRPYDEFRRVVLHEFGHTIGLEHELRSPDSNIQWDSSAVYKYYLTTYKWCPKMVDDNIFTKINTNAYTRFDSNSIMIYAVPGFLTKNHQSITWKENLSFLDKKTIRSYYLF